jgi:hypothetical protein
VRSWRRGEQSDEHTRALQQLRRDLDRGLQHGVDPFADLPPSTHAFRELPPAPEPKPPRKSHGPLLPALAVVLGLLAFVLVSNPGGTGYWAKEMVRRATGGTSASYAFMSTVTATGQPVAWDHCQVIRYRINPEDAPEGWQPLVEDAVQEVSRASGLRFAYDGPTPDRDYLERTTTAPVLIGWGSAAEHPQLAGDVAGFGGASSVRVGDLRRYVTGAVLLDSGAFDQMQLGGRQDAMRLILVHELLHVIGLDHVEDDHELMYASYHGQDGLGAGDEAGLQRLADVPCA